jgi:hypothetical protein
MVKVYAHKYLVKTKFMYIFVIFFSRFSWQWTLFIFNLNEKKNKIGSSILHDF